jgi:hypothetical protein
VRQRKTILPDRFDVHYQSRRRRTISLIEI